MLIDPRVARKKFDREVERLERQKKTLASRGCVVVDVAYPAVDVLFLPKQPLGFALAVAVSSGPSLVVGPTGQPPAAALGWARGQVDALGARPFVARFSLDDFDIRAPSLTFLDPFARRPLAYGELPLGHLLGPDGRPQLVVLNEHPATKRPFLCVRGVREYHEHSQHTGDDWFQYRGAIGLFHLVDVVHRTCVAETRPVFVNAPGQVQVQWQYVKAS